MTRAGWIAPPPCRVLCDSLSAEEHQDIIAARDVLFLFLKAWNSRDEDSMVRATEQMKEIHTDDSGLWRGLGGGVDELVSAEVKGFGDYARGERITLHFNMVIWVEGFHHAIENPLDGSQFKAGGRRL